MKTLISSLMILLTSFVATANSGSTYKYKCDTYVSDDRSYFVTINVGGSFLSSNSFTWSIETDAGEAYPQTQKTKHGTAYGNQLCFKYAEAEIFKTVYTHYCIEAKYTLEPAKQIQITQFSRMGEYIQVDERNRPRTIHTCTLMNNL